MNNMPEKNYGKLYDPSSADSFVWHMIPKNHKAGTPPSFLLTREPSPKPFEERGYTLVNPVQLGMYDKDGFYHTYKPPIEGVAPGKYVRVLQEHELEDAKNQYERDKINRRHGAKPGMELAV